MTTVKSNPSLQFVSPIDSINNKLIINQNNAVSYCNFHNVLSKKVEVI